MTSKYYFIMKNGYEVKTIKFYIECPAKWFLQVPNDNDIYCHHASRDILLSPTYEGNRFGRSWH